MNADTDRAALVAQEPAQPADYDLLRSVADVSTATPEPTWFALAELSLSGEVAWRIRMSRVEFADRRDRSFPAEWGTPPTDATERALWIRSHATESESRSRVREIERRYR